jgi:hypothetical protein
MKQYTSYLIIALALFVAAIFATVAYDLKTKLNRFHDAVSASSDSVRYWRDRTGQEHASKKLAQADYEQLIDLYRHDIDSVSARLSIRPKQITGIGEASTNDSGRFISVLTPVYIHDTVEKSAPRKAYVFSHSDRWLTIRGEIDTDVSINYLVRDSITITTYWKRKWFGGKKEYYIDGYSANPNCSVYGLTGIKATDKSPSRIGVGLFAGVGYNLKPTVGVGVYYSLFNL